MEDSSQKKKILVMLRELQRIWRIEDLGERIRQFEEFIPKLQDFAYYTEDKTLIEAVENLKKSEKQSRAFHELESLAIKLEQLKMTLERVTPIVSFEVAQNFQRCIDRFEGSLIETRRRGFQIIQNFEKVSDQVTRQLIGRRLEKEIVPDLAKQLGYTLRPNILPTNGEEIEVDFLGEKDTTTSPFGMGRLTRKKILIVECKTTISKNDIAKFAKKVDLIKDKYGMSASVFKYETEYEVWIFSCYGWTEELKELARKNDIEPFDENEIVEILRRHRLLDRRFPVCP